MKVLKRMKKKRVLGVLFLLFLLLFGILRSRDYETQYEVDSFLVKESYSKDSKMYTFSFSKDGNVFSAAFQSKYKHHKKFVSTIEVKAKENTLCIFPSGKEFSFYPLCVQDGENISYHLVQDEEIIPSDLISVFDEEEKTYQNIKMYDLGEHKYFLWNYKGFTVVDKKGVREIPLFSNDVYTIPLTVQVNDSILMADYESSYVFRKFYVIQSKNEKVKEFSLEKELSFDSYFLGPYSKYAYLVDKKNKKEYEIYPKKMKLRSITKNEKGKIFLNGEWQEVSMTSLVTNEQKFSDSSVNFYTLENNTLYSNLNGSKMKVSNHQVKEIVSYTINQVYYLVDDKLYTFTPSSGEVLVLSNFEWNFNYKNMIYIF